MARRKLAAPDAFDVLSERIHEAAGLLKAMASDTRLMILCALNDGELPVNKLAEMTGQSSSAVSQHLAKLRAAGLVQSRREAQTIYYACTKGVGKNVVDVLCEFYSE